MPDTTKRKYVLEVNDKCHKFVRVYAAERQIKLKDAAIEILEFIAANDKQLTPCSD